MKRTLFAAVLALTACGPAGEYNATGLVMVQPMTPRSLPAFFDCLRQNSATIVSAHRGGPSPGFAENSIDTFLHTLSQAPVFLEVDVARTRDGVLVLMHDDTVERTTDGEGAVGAMSSVEFAALSLQDHSGGTLDGHPPTLREAMDWARGKAVLELDVKRGVSYEAVAREVEDAGAMGRVVFITYSVDGASRLARVAPEAMIYTTVTSARDLDTLDRRGVDLSRIVAWLGDDELDAGLVRALAERGVETRFGVFGRDHRFAEIAEAGVQSLAVDDVAAAYRAADAADGEQGYAALRCAAAQ